MEVAKLTMARQTARRETGRGPGVRIRAAQLSLTTPTHWFETHVRSMGKGPLQFYFSERGNRVVKWNRRGLCYPHSSRHCSGRARLVSGVGVGVVGLHSARRATVYLLSARAAQWVITYSLIINIQPLSFDDNEEQCWPSVNPNQHNYLQLGKPS